MTPTIYNKKELYEIIKNLLKNNNFEINNIQNINNELIILINIINNKSIIICNYIIIYDLINKIIKLNIIKNKKKYNNLPLYISLYINPLNYDFKIIKINENKIGGSSDNNVGIGSSPIIEKLNTSKSKSPKINKIININNNEVSSIDNITKNHNIFKEYNLNQSIKILNNVNINELSLLDLGCRVGNDLNRWIKLKIKRVVGIDISEKSLIEANERYKNNKNMNKINIKFYQSDLSKYDEKLTNILKKEKKFNIITCNFVIHYLFVNEKALRNLFQIINNNLELGGLFIGSAFDKNLVLKTYNELKKKENPKLEIIPMNNFENESLNYNRKYSIRLGLKTDINTYFSDGPSDEYLVDYNELSKIAFEYNLKLIYFKNFKDIYNEVKNTYNCRKLSHDDEQISFMNYSFKFRKIK